MQQNDFQPLQKYLETLPKPTTIREKLLCLWSDMMDTVLILAAKIKKIGGRK